MDFGKFMDEHPTVFHFTEGVERLLDSRGFHALQERDLAKVERGGKYYITRNGSTLVAFVVGQDFIPGPDGYSIVISHIDANRMCLKPTSLRSSSKELGYIQLGASAYADGGNRGWWDRDLGLGGRVIVRTPSNSVTSKLVRLPGVIGSIPSLAPHFGALSEDRNPETREVPIIGMYDSDGEKEDGVTPEEAECPLVSKHPIQLIRAVANQLGVNVCDILEWDLELFSAEKASVGGLNGEFLYCSRMDDRLCSFAAVKGLIEAAGRSTHTTQVVALYDNEEIGSETRTGAVNKLLNCVLGHVAESLYADADSKKQSLANSFIVSADVTHAGHPSYSDDAYLAGSTPKLNTGMAVKRLGRFSSDGVDSSICYIISEEAGLSLQYFSPRNDVRSGGTVGQLVASSTGIRTVDVGIPVLAMHSIREVTGSKDVGLGIRWFRTFFSVPIPL